jgi:hypothetical protein
MLSHTRSLPKQAKVRTLGPVAGLGLMVKDMLLIVWIENQAFT